MDANESTLALVRELWDESAPDSCSSGAWIENVITSAFSSPRDDTMTPADFLALLESTLQHRRVAFSRAAAIAFVESCWELIEDDPDVDGWADRFVEAGAVEVPC